MPRLAWACLLIPLIARADDAVATLTNVSVQTSAGGVTIRLDLTQPRQPAFHELRDPYRVYFDLPDTLVRGSAGGTRAIASELIGAVRTAQFQREPPIARVVLDVKGRQPVKVATADEGRTIFLGLGAGGGRPEPGPPAPPTQRVTALRWLTETAGDATLRLDLSGAARVDSFYLSAPDRVVVDVEGAALAAAPPVPGAANGLVDAVRLSQFEADVVRCVLDLKRPAAHAVTVRQAPAGVEIRLTAGGTDGRLVIVDAGHGGHDPGCSGVHGAKEKAVVLAVALKVRDLLKRNGIGALMTRDDDTFVDLYERPAIGNRAAADCFVSIHCNAMPTDKRGTRSGTEVYYYHDHSALLAGLLLQETAGVIGLEPRGTFVRRFVVVRESAIPAALVELGYLDHAGDGGKLITSAFQDRCAQGIVGGIKRFLERTPRRVRPEPVTGPAAPPRDPQPGDEPEATPVRPLTGGD